MNPEATREIYTHTARASSNHIRPALSHLSQQSDMPDGFVPPVKGVSGEFTVLPLGQGLARAGSLFAGQSAAEASANWFCAVAETTLEPGERAVLALLTRAGLVRAALPLAQNRNGTLRGLTAPYTTKFAVAAQSAADGWAL